MRVAILLLLFGCDSDIHDVGDCGTWPFYAGSAQAYECERACADEPDGYDDPAGGSMCVGSNPGETQTLDCNHPFLFEGAQGCCQLIPKRNAPARIEFFVCTSK